VVDLAAADLAVADLAAADLAVADLAAADLAVADLVVDLVADPATDLAPAEYLDGSSCWSVELVMAEPPGIRAVARCSFGGGIPRHGAGAGEAAGDA
jgi:hypothetical protein